MNEKIILGIDPGTTIMGFGLIKVKDKKMSLILIFNIGKIVQRYLLQFVKL